MKKCERALSHINNSLTEIKDVIEKPVNRKRELFDEELTPRPWASNEIEFVNSNLNKMDCLVTGTNVIAHDIQYVFHQLEKRFDAASIRSNEQNRKARRHNEQRYKAKRKRASVAMRKMALNRNTNNGNDRNDGDDDAGGDTNSKIYDYDYVDDGGSDTYALDFTMAEDILNKHWFQLVYQGSY